MTLRNRFLLVGFGMVLFIFTTPIIVLYARGFKVDWENKRIIKTGTLVVNSEPTKTDIFLNDEKIDQTTDANIRFLLPGDYIVRLEKNGYQSWTKRLSIKSQLVTWASSGRDFITLFYTQPLEFDQTEDEEIKKLITPKESTNPEEIQQILKNLNIEIPNFATIQSMRNNGQIYLILDDTLYLVNDNLEKIYSPVIQAYWDNNSAKLVYWNNNEINIYDPNTKTSDLILRSVTPVQNPILNFETGYIFYQNENKIKAIELDKRDHRNIFTIADAQDQFAISDDGKKLYTISPAQSKTYKIR